MSHVFYMRSVFCRFRFALFLLMIFFNVIDIRVSFIKQRRMGMRQWTNITSLAGNIFCFCLCLCIFFNDCPRCIFRILNFFLILFNIIFKLSNATKLCKINRRTNKKNFGSSSRKLVYDL